MTDNPGEPRRKSRTVLLILCAFVLPVVVFLISVAGWWAVNGVPDGGRGMLGGLGLLIGVVLIGGGYWLADRYWVRPKR
jgi:hypothetical protein